jgi:hypothetical protein
MLEDMRQRSWSEHSRVFSDLSELADFVIPAGVNCQACRRSLRRVEKRRTLALHGSSKTKNQNGPHAQDQQA